MQIVSWRGWEPADDDLWIGMADDVRGAWMPSFSTTPRLGSESVVTAVHIGDRVINCEFGNDHAAAPSRTAEEIWALGLQRLNPLDTSEGELIIELNDNSQWSCMARITLPGSVVDGTVDTFDVVWFATDPLWHALESTTETGVLAPSAIPNPSFATNTNGWTMGALPANVTASFTRDASVFYGVAGSGHVEVTVNSGSGGTWYVLNDAEFPCAEGDVITVAAAVRSSVGVTGGDGLNVFPVLRYYDDTDTMIVEHGPDYISIGEEPANVWQRFATMDTPAPADTAYARIGARIHATASQTGSVYFDDFGFPAAPDGSATLITVEGNAPTHLKLTATPVGNFPQSIYARQFTLTNNGVRVIENKPLMILLDDNTGGATSGAYWALLRDGRVQRCEISDYDSPFAFLWMVVDYLPVGETAEYTLLVSDQTVLPGVAWQFNSYTRPAFDIGYHYGTASGGSHTTTVTNTSGLGSEANRWRDGIIRGLTGANAGLNRRISASTATSITVSSAFPNAFSNTDQYVILMSHNGILDSGQADWVYAVRQTERNDSFRGLYYIPSGQTQPSDYREDVPGAWHLDLYYDNNDRFAQPWVTAVDPGGGDDFFTILNAYRSWERRPRRDKELAEDGGYDGVAINTAFPVTTLVTDFQLLNPNRMGRFVVRARRTGNALGGEHVYENSDAHDTLTVKSAATIAMPADTYEVGLNLIPNYGNEVGTDWAEDSGTATSGTTTTLGDNTRNWIADQYIGGEIRIIRGTGAGNWVTITDNSANTITVAAWPNGTPDSTSAYLIRNRPLMANVRNHQRFRMSQNMTNLAISAVTPETPAFVLYRDILINAVDGGDETEIQRVAINPETTGRYIVLLADESLVVDGQTMRAWVADTGTGDELHTVPPQAYSVLTVDEDGNRRAAQHWLRVNPGDYTVTLASDETGVACTVDVEFTESVYS